MGTKKTWIILISLACALAALNTGYLFYKWFEQVEARKSNLIVPPLPLPDFSLTAEDGRTVSRADLRGKIWLADFIFTRCSGQCSMMNLRMRAVQKLVKESSRLSENVRLISFSVDPEHDSLAVLESYSRRNEADPALWSFLRGEAGEVAELSEKGFLLSAGLNPEASKDPGLDPAYHSDRLVIVDELGRQRARFRIDPLKDTNEEIVDFLHSLVSDMKRGVNTVPAEDAKP